MASSMQEHCVGSQGLHTSEKIWLNEVRLGALIPLSRDSFFQGREIEVLFAETGSGSHGFLLSNFAERTLAFLKGRTGPNVRLPGSTTY